uniref:Uncharacterized protein n=1 Tax=Strongyloides stercoralis TaxID=6248 RepID=A0AAF5HZ72_STRER
MSSVYIATPGTNVNGDSGNKSKKNSKDVNNFGERSVYLTNPVYQGNEGYIGTNGSRNASLYLSTGVNNCNGTSVYATLQNNGGNVNAAPYLNNTSGAGIAKSGNPNGTGVSPAASLGGAVGNYGNPNGTGVSPSASLGGAAGISGNPNGAGVSSAASLGGAAGISGNINGTGVSPGTSLGGTAGISGDSNGKSPIVPGLSGGISDKSGDPNGTGVSPTGLLGGTVGKSGDLNGTGVSPAGSLGGAVGISGDSNGKGLIATGISGGGVGNSGDFNGKGPIIAGSTGEGVNKFGIPNDTGTSPAGLSKGNVATFEGPGNGSTFSASSLGKNVGLGVKNNGVIDKSVYIAQSIEKSAAGSGFFIDANKNIILQNNLPGQNFVGKSQKDYTSRGMNDSKVNSIGSNVGLSQNNNVLDASTKGVKKNSGEQKIYSQIDNISCSINPLLSGTDKHYMNLSLNQSTAKKQGNGQDEEEDNNNDDDNKYVMLHSEVQEKLKTKNGFNITNQEGLVQPSANTTTGIKKKKKKKKNKDNVVAVHIIYEEEAQ